MYETIADFYDSEFRGWNEDLYFYLKLLKPGSRILELGSGTGRLTIPLAQKGHFVTGIEMSPAMLDTARRSVEGLPLEIQGRITWIHGDFLNLNVPTKFDCILAPFSALNFLTREKSHISVFNNLREQLNPKGRFIADIVFEKTSGEATRRETEKSFCHCTHGTLIKKKSVETPENGHEISVQQIYEERDYLSGKLLDRRENAIKLYVFPPDEIIQKLESAGFFVEEIFGGYHETPFDKNKSARMLIVAKRS